MATRIPLVLTLLTLSVLPARSQTVATPAANPCAKSDEFTTRDQILAAVPAEDQAWADALNRRGIRKEESGWMQYFSGGSATASNRAFTVAFGDYCAEKARAASAPKRKPVVRTAEAVTQDVAGAKERTKRVGGNFALASSVQNAAPEPVAVAVDCSALCEPVRSCADAGMGGGNLGSDFRCRKAGKDASAAGCSCN